MGRAMVSGPVDPRGADTVQPTAREPSTPPALDSGRGWLVVAAAFVANSVGFGILLTFGVFLEDIAEDLGTGTGATAALFSTTAALYYVMSGVVGPVSDRIGPRPVLAVGSVCLVSGLWLCAQASSITGAYVALVPLGGIGIATVYAPMVGAVGGWFERRRSSALGVALVGVGFGGLVTAPLARSLLEHHGWRRTFELFAIGAGVLLATCVVLVARPPVAHRLEATSLRVSLLSRTFAVMYLGVLLLSLAFYVPFVLLASSAEARGLSGTSAALLLSTLSAGSILGRLTFGVAGDRWGVYRLYRGSFGLMTVCFAIWLVAGSSFALLFLAALSMGLGWGGFVALMPVVLAEWFDIERLGGLVGVLLTSFAIGALVGPPALGALRDATSDSWAIAVAGVPAALSVVVIGRLGPPPGRERH